MQACDPAGAIVSRSFGGRYDKSVPGQKLPAILNSVVCCNSVND